MLTKMLWFCGGVHEVIQNQQGYGFVDLSTSEVSRHSIIDFGVVAIIYCYIVDTGVDLHWRWVVMWYDELCEFGADKMFLEVFMSLICDDWWCKPYLRTYRVILDV